jgi:hypothetical protein
MSKSQVQVDKNFLINTPAPNHGATYTVIEHKDVMRFTEDYLRNSGFYITNELYRANGSGEVAQGIYHIKPMNSNDVKELDLGMMFAWTNSYDKSLRFHCAVGAYVMACSNGMICGELNYSRRHIGSADFDIKNHISEQINNSRKVYSNIITDKNSLKATGLDKSKQGEILGDMFINDLIGPRQMVVVKEEMEKASYNYGVDQETAWAFYNHVTHAYKSTHPRQWMKTMKIFHDYMMAKISSMPRNSIVDTPAVSMIDDIDIDFDSAPIEFDL